MVAFPPRFESRMKRSVEPGGCWVWISRVHKRYGWYSWNCKTQGAHRVAWQIANGSAIPGGMHVLHRCDNPLCVRPDHLFLGTHLDNMRDMKMKGRARASRGPRKDFCCRAHPLAGDNLMIARDGKRRCRACAQEAHRLSRLRLRAKRNGANA